MVRTRRDLTGERFGKLVVIEQGPDYHCPAIGQQYARWQCLCDCGRLVLVRGDNLKSGNSTSCGHVHRTLAPTYKAAHARVRRARGSATRHPCVDCGDPAEQWSYIGGSPDEITGTVDILSDGYRYTSTVAWSPNVDDYQPRCIPCHRNYDKQQRRKAAA